MELSENKLHCSSESVIRMELSENKTILIFHHTDLDGIGVKIVGEMYAASKNHSYKSYRCNYGDVNEIIQKVLNKTDLNSIEEILIGDISVNEEVAEYLDYLHKNNVKIRLRDHHKTAEWLNKYSWAQVSEDVDGILRCGTWLLSMSDGFEEIYSKFKVFIDTVDSWDTWKWKTDDNSDAHKLNSLFQALGTNDFTRYICHNYSHSLDRSKLFDSHADIWIESHSRHVCKVTTTCEKHLSVSDMTFTKPNGDASTYKVGMVFCNTDLSDVADKILSKHADLDVLMLMTMPRSISLRTQKNLDISMGDLASMLTGSGGGHPKAAGATISSRKFKKFITEFFNNIADTSLDFDSFKFGGGSE